MFQMVLYGPILSNLVKYCPKLFKLVYNYPAIKISSFPWLGILNERIIVFIIKDIELETVNLKKSTAISKILHHSSEI